MRPRADEHPVLAWLRTQEPAMVDLLRRLVEAESPSIDPAAHARVVGLLEGICGFQFIPAGYSEAMPASIPS